MVEDRDGELLSHEMEGYLRAIRDGDVPLTTHGIEVLIEGTAALERAITARRDSSDPPDSAGPLASLRGLLSQPTPVRIPGNGRRAGDSVDPAADWTCMFEPSAALSARGINVNAVRERLSSAGVILRATPSVTEHGVSFHFLLAGELDDATVAAWRDDGIVCTRIPGRALLPIGPESGESPGARALAPPSHYVRVDLARLDELMHMIGDLVMLRARLTDTLASLQRHAPSQGWRAIQEQMTAIERQVRALREGVMRVRLVPVGEILGRMPFAVRDMARDTGRRVTVELAGEDTQMDKFLVERMMDPVLQLVRNAVSHGIEPADERVAAGKPADGTIRLRASAAGNLVAIEVADDGRGIDVPRVLQRARQLALPVPADGDDAALLDVICSPGFSTREKSDHLSGRGFGMDVVCNRVHELGGSLRMVTTPGSGTRFIIELPLTLAIIEALIARVGGQTFAVPQLAVHEVIELSSAAIHRIEGSEVTEYRGAALRMIRLSDLLGITDAPPSRLHAFVLGDGSAAFGLVVDQVVGQREIVVRATADPLIRVEGIAGATDLGDGRAVLIVDASALARRAPLRKIA